MHILNIKNSHIATTCFVFILWHLQAALYQQFKTYWNILDFKTFAVFWMLHVFFWVIPGVWSLYADVSEHSVCYIFIGGYIYPAYEDGTDRVFRDVGI